MTDAGQHSHESYMRRQLGPLYDAVQEFDETEAREEIQRDHIETELRQGAAFWRRCLADQAGRRELYRFFEACRVFDAPFAAGPVGFPDPQATFFQWGERAAGERLMHKLASLDRLNFFAMLDEHDPRYAARRREIRNA
jgi:hypothetical protein